MMNHQWIERQLCFCCIFPVVLGDRNLYSTFTKRKIESSFSLKLGSVKRERERERVRERDRQTDRQTDRRTDGRTEGRTDRDRQRRRHRRETEKRGTLEQNITIEDISFQH